MAFKSIPCPCGGKAGIVGGAVIYPHRPDLNKKSFYLCDACGAYVGCHPGSDRPLGIPADAATRRARNKAHAAFDPLWKGAAMFTRKEAYALLRRFTGLSAERCHIAMMDADQCEKVAAFFQDKRAVARWAIGKQTD